MKQYAIVGLAAFLLALVGCEEKTFDQRLVDITVKQGEHEDQISRIATRIEGVDRRLEEIQQTLEKIPPASGAPEPVKVVEEEATEPEVVEFKDTPEYKQIVAQLSTIQQQLNLTRSGVEKAQQDAASERERAQLRDPRQAMSAMTNPQEMNKRLDLLLQNFGQKIQDPQKRQQFEADLNRFRQSLSGSRSAQDLYAQIADDLNERLLNEENERSRERIQRELQSLESASGEDLEGRLDRYQRMQTFRQIRDLTTTYNIPRETLQDSGLPAMGRGSGPSRGGRGDRRPRRGR